MAVENQVANPMSQAPSRGAEVLRLRPSGKNPLLVPTPPSDSVANTGPLDYISALRPFLNDENEIPAPRKAKMAAPDDLTDAKLGRAAAETDTKIARVEGKIETLTATLAGKLDLLHGDIRSLHGDIQKSDGYNRDTRLIIVSTLVVGVLTLAGLMVAMASYGDAMFGRGMNVQDVVKAVAREYATQAPASKKP